MLERLLTERPNPASERIDQVSSEELLRIINAEDRRAPEAVAREIPRLAEALDAVWSRYRAGGRLFYIGAGTSGRLGALDAAEIPPTFGEKPERVVAIIAGGPAALTRAVEGAEDSPEQGARDLADQDLKPADAVVGLAASGRTPYVLGALDYARSRGALTIGVTTNPEGEIIRRCDLAIAPDVGPEIIAGSTRMKSGTAQKLVLNMLSTGLMIKMGYVLGNRMIHVQPTNEKLRHRARRLVAEIAGVDDETAAAALTACGGVARAILAARFSLSPAEAAARLERHEGVLRRALQE